MGVRSTIFNIMMGGVIASSTSTLSAMNHDFEKNEYPINYVYEREFFIENGNNISYMGEFDEDSALNNKINYMIDNFCCKVTDCNLEDLSNFDYFNFLDQIRKEEEYGVFLKKIWFYNNYKLLEYVMVYLMQFDFVYVTGDEEHLVIKCLTQNDDIQLQESALNTIFAWDKISNINELSDIKIENTYLQEALDDFIREHS